VPIERNYLTTKGLYAKINQLDIPSEMTLILGAKEDDAKTSLKSAKIR
jgi:hypothetical protein